MSFYQKTERFTAEKKIKAIWSVFKHLKIFKIENFNKMIRKRKSKNKVSSNCDNLEEQSSDEKKKKKMSPKLSKQREIVDVSQLSSPTFNIHIHVPPCNVRSPKIYLPRIQPVVHLHFDEIARKLDASQIGKGEEFWGKMFETLLPLATPKFGDVKFHFNDKSGGGHFKKSNETSCSIRTHCNDSQHSRGKGKEKTQMNASKRSKVVCKTSDNESTSKKDFNNISNEILLSKYKDLNLKKAVVVLTDICKSKSWKNVETQAVSDFDKSQKENTYSENELDINNENVEHERFQFKQENESFTPSSTFYKSHIVNNTLENDGSFVKLEEIIVNRSTVQDMVANNKSLTALVEGCNFSEILNRFRAKSKQSNGNTRPAECQVGLSNNNVKEDCFNKVTTGDTNVEDSNCDPYSDIHRTELKSDRDVSDKNTSLFQMRDDNFRVEKENFVRESDEETVDFEFSAMRHNNTGTESDKVSFALERHSSTEDAVVDSGTLEINSSFKINSNHEGNFKVSEAQGSCSFDVEDFHLQLIQEEMKQRSRNNKNLILKPGRKSDNTNGQLLADGMKEVYTKLYSNIIYTLTLKQPRIVRPGFVKSNTSSPKKMKPSDKTFGKTSKSSSSSPSLSTEDYIPLNASGSTRFAVTPLDKIQPYKTHAAKNFKQEMLFGNRIDRFSSSDKLRIYQMKQAARKSIKKQDK